MKIVGVAFKNQKSCFQCDTLYVDVTYVVYVIVSMQRFILSFSARVFKSCNAQSDVDALLMC